MHFRVLGLVADPTPDIILHLTFFLFRIWPLFLPLPFTHGPHFITAGHANDVRPDNRQRRSGEGAEDEARLYPPHHPEPPGMTAKSGTKKAGFEIAKYDNKRVGP